MMGIFWRILVVILTLVALFLIWQFGASIILFLLSLAIAAALRPLVNNIAARNTPRRFALAIVYFSVIASILIFILIVAPPLGRDLQTASDDMVRGYDKIKQDWPGGGSMFRKALAEQLPPSGDLYKALTSREGEPARQGVLIVAQDFFSLLGSIMLVIVLSLYWSADQLRFERLGLSMLPKDEHAKALHTWRAVELAVGAYIRSEIVQGILAFVFLSAGYWLLGVRYPTLLSLWGTFLRIVPWFGILAASFPAFFAGPNGLLAALYTFTVLVVLKLAVEPRFVPAHRTNSLFMILFIICMWQFFGLIGAMLAPLLVVAIQTVFHELYPTSPYRFSPPLLSKEQELSQRITDLRTRLGNNGLHPEAKLVVDRLSDLLSKTKSYMED